MLQESYQNVEALYEQYEFVKFIPFNPTDKYTIAFIKDKHSGETIRLMKGAPQVNPPSQLLGCLLSLTSLALVTALGGAGSTCWHAPGSRPSQMDCCSLQQGPNHLQHAQASTQLRG